MHAMFCDVLRHDSGSPFWIRVLYVLCKWTDVEGGGVRGAVASWSCSRTVLLEYLLVAR